MTLRARLTAAFLAVVLGPVLLGAIFVGLTVAAVSRNRSSERLDLAAAGVRAAMGTACQRLHTAAETAALLGGSPNPIDSSGEGGSATDHVPVAEGNARWSAAAHSVVDRKLATAALLTANGVAPAAAGLQPAMPWVDCGSPTTGQLPRFGGISAQVEIRDPAGALVGHAIAVDAVDPVFIARLASAGGAAITLISDDRTASTEQSSEIDEVVAAARRLGPGARGISPSGRHLQRIDPQPGQPLSMVLSIPGSGLEGLYAVLVAVVLAAGLVAITAAWNLARSTTRPLTELAVAVDRVAEGDLAARVPVRASDEVGRLGVTFNRMTREMQGYVQALTASRDQLRRQLGVLGDTLSSTHDLNRILHVILQTATAATGAQGGVVLLVDEATATLVGQCGEGLGGRGVPVDLGELRIPLGGGLLGTVAATGEPRRGRTNRDGPQFSTFEPHCVTYIAVPFSAPGAGPTMGLAASGAVEDDENARPNVLGVLALYDRHGFDEFDDADLVTLQTFAGQVAVALDNVRIHEEAQRLSLTDALTGLSNYRYLRESLRREIERASRFGHPLSVLVLDLDHFKEINDTYGHVAGDAVLAEFARRLRAVIREVDFAFRQGGEEFVVLLPETNAAGALVVAQRLREAVRRTPVLIVSHHGGPPLRVPVTVSAGVAVYPEHGETGLAVLEAADGALYAAKTSGRDCFRISGADPEGTVSGRDDGRSDG